MKKYHRNPSRHKVEEHDLLKWLKAIRKKMCVEVDRRLSGAVNNIKISKNN